MIQVSIPGRGMITLKVLVLDYNGTLALDGKMFDSVKRSIKELSPLLDIHILTADTCGTVIQECEGLPVHVKVLESNDHTKEKMDYVTKLKRGEVIAVGNGANDQLMLKHACLGIIVIGPEGASTKTLLSADIIVHKIEDAFGLLLEPKRLIATLRV